MIALFAAALQGGPARAAETTVAVAANFTATAKDIARSFEAETGNTVRLSFASTGKLYTQIINGAPFEVFLAADGEHPQRLEAEGFVVPGSRFTYALGRLVLWSAKPGPVDDQALKAPSAKRIAIANPMTAPYGAAAVGAMRALGVYDTLRDRLVRGDSVAQAYQFVATGNAELGFVALSQALADPRGSFWEVPQDLHAPIRQDAVLLATGANSETAKAFLGYLKGPAAGAIMRQYGYERE
jgi:molybdate transport system substrate-binding protein